MIRSLSIIALFFVSFLSAQVPCNLPPPYDCSELTINALSGYVDNNGSIRRLYYPTTNTFLFDQLQLMLGATVNGTVRYAVGYYQQGPTTSDYSPGPIINGRPDTVIANFPTLYRVYRIARNWESFREGSEKEVYRNDHAQWPVDLGAPVDRNGKPLFLGDQTTFSVWNDLDTMNRSQIQRALGAEIRMTTWAYTEDPVLKNIIFVKYTIINKSDTVWNDFYAGNYLGGGIGNTRSFAGTDSVLELQYVYSSVNSTVAFATKMPAIGFTQLQGPIVPSPGSLAFNFGRFIPDARNLRIRSGSTNFVPFDEKIYLSLQGIDPSTQQLYVNPVTGRSGRFNYTGDPVTGAGWTEPNYSPDLSFSFRETMISSGPLTVKPKDTVTIVGALIAAQGKDRLQSVAILKYFARYARSKYLSLLNPEKLPNPVTSRSVLDGKVILTWDTNSEFDLPDGYRFQGYNVYQGETANGPWHRIFTADKTDNITVLSEETYQPEFSTLASRGIQLLPNIGLQHHLIVDRDSIASHKIINGRPYYFSVRAFWENSENRPMVTESQDLPVTVIPEQIVPGSEIVDPLTLIPHNRVHDDALRIEVVDPVKLKNNRFSVVVHSVNDTITWDVFNQDTQSPVLTNLRITAGESTPVIDGFTLRLKKQLIGVRRDNQNPRGWEYLPESNRWMTGASPEYFMDGFFYGLVYPTLSNFVGRGGSKTLPHELKRIEMRFSNSVTQKAYRYVDKVRGVPFNDPPKHPSFGPFILRHGMGYVYQDYVDVPFTVWEIDSLDGDLSPKQLAVAFVETNDSLYSPSGKYLGRGNVDGKWHPTAAANGGGEMIYFFSSPYTAEPQPQYLNNNINLFFRPDSFDIMYVFSSRTDTVLKKIKPFSYQEGDLFRITPNYQFADGQTYTFTSSPGIVGNKKLAFDQKAMEKITIFPNPYMGGHTLEQSASQRFVRILNLPAPSTVRIFTMSGRLIRTFMHSNASSGTSDWDLRNDEGIKVASGLYVIHIDSPGIGSKVLKLSVLYPDERLNAY